MQPALLANPLIVLGVVLALGALLGDGAERLRIPWITGCIIAGVLLGPAASGVLTAPALSQLAGFTQSSLALIAFNIGGSLEWTRLRGIGGSVVLLAAAQLLAPVALVLAAESLLGLALPAALVVAAVAAATAPTTTYSVIHRRDASGPFVDRVMGILALNDGATILIFSVVSAAAVALLAAGSDTLSMGTALQRAAVNEALSVAAGIVLGLAYLGVRRLIEDGTPGWEGRLTAVLLSLLVIAIGGAAALGLSQLLVPLSLGIVVANGVEGAERARVHALLRGIEEPMFIVFFVLAGAHLPVTAAEHLTVLGAASVYLMGRFAGKYGSLFFTARALGLDRATGRYLGLCFPSQGALAMGLLLAFSDSPTLSQLQPSGREPIHAAISIVLVGVLVSQLVGPLLIDYAIRHAGETSPASGDEKATDRP